MNLGMAYRSKITGFIAEEEPYVDKIYYKFDTETKAIIYVGSGWVMHGDVLDPFFFIPAKFTLDQYDCERLILQNTPIDREDILKRMKLDKYDTAQMLYRSRGITLQDLKWFAWSEDDKIEDYHPLRNQNALKAMQERDKDIFID